MPMLRDAAPPPPLPMRPPDDHGRPAEPCWSTADTAVLAMSLFTTWAARTGRVLRNVPISELTPAELIEFWADDQLEDERPDPFPASRAHTTVIAVDIVGFGRRCRDTATQRRVRREMYGRLGEAFAAAGLPWRCCRCEDRGDGALIVAPAGVDPVHCLDRLAHRLAVILRGHNRFADDAARLRLRMAVHHGYVERDDYGVFSPATMHLFRLLEARSFKEALRAAGADLGVITSDTLYTEAVLRGGGRAALSAYRPLRVSCKEIRRAKAWLWLPSGLVTGMEDR
ncbi:hypothetical protein E1287_19565 [Actinomadura sp. KC06]|uniref:hypothetical protein n=1 Tax=Actinomadura sp. KC06 TaxID=2530369 RepID=UPI001053B000|nr:hypothetical protein [Actinomadura sp. KC06]TDD33388.1 hypothetical protein E1287_19565 [Actinomadura sp. KC06]